ncbi:hypothetical protein ACOMHN_036798 [Nucella lapillus]
MVSYKYYTVSYKYYMVSYKYYTVSYKYYTVFCKYYMMSYKYYMVSYKYYTVSYKYYMVSYKYYTVSYKYYTVFCKYYMVSYKYYMVSYKYYTVSYKYYMVSYKYYTVSYKYYTNNVELVNSFDCLVTHEEADITLCSYMLKAAAGLTVNTFQDLPMVQELSCSGHALGNDINLLGIKIFTLDNRQTLAYVNVKDEKCSTSGVYSACLIDPRDSRKSRLVTLLVGWGEEEAEEKEYGCNVTGFRPGLEVYSETWSLTVKKIRYKFRSLVLLSAFWTGLVTRLESSSWGQSAHVCFAPGTL